MDNDVRPDDTLVDVVLRTTHRCADRVALRFLRDGSVEDAVLSFADLDQRARVIAGFLQDRGLTGERVLLSYPPGLDYYVAFIGCLYAGVTIVPLLPPKGTRSKARFTAVTTDAKPAAVLCAAEALEAASEAAVQGGSQGLPAFDIQKLDASYADLWRRAPSRRTDAAFLQYTSGSTATPKGVVITHDNLMCQEELLRIAMRGSSTSRMVTWLPPHHDMGLIGGLLHPLYCGFECIWMPPGAFLHEPVRWLRAISRYRATISGAPNFAYELCADSIGPQEREGLDLSSWETAYNGAESVRYDTLKRFTEAFATAGFRFESFAPCYGLAEATLMVSGGHCSAGPMVLWVDKQHLQSNEIVPARGAQAIPLVSSGEIRQDAIIVDPDTAMEQKAGRIGEIWVQGSSVGAGYWFDDHHTTIRFSAKTHEPGPDDRAHLRTGDLGFIAQGHLFVVGRMSDVIIQNGEKHHAADIERTAEQAHPALCRNAAAAFAVSRDSGAGERVILLIESVARSSDDCDGIITTIRRAVGAQHELDLHGVVLVRSGLLPKTTSGKIRRADSKQTFLSGTLQSIARWVVTESLPDNPRAAPNAPAAYSDIPGAAAHLAPVVESAWITTLKCRPLQADDDFLLLGGNSLNATQIAAILSEKLSLKITLADLFARPVLRDFVAWLSQAAAVPVTQTAANEETSDTAPCDEYLPLSSYQENIWFLENLTRANPFYHIGIRLNVNGTFSVAAFQQALNAVVSRHEALRAAFREIDGVPRQRFRDPHPIPLEIIQEHAKGLVSTEEWIEQRFREETCREFDLAAGPMLRARCLVLAGQPAAVLLVIHHLCCDGIGARNLLRDLVRHYNALRSGRGLPGRAPVHSFGRYCKQRSAAPPSTSDRDFWVARLHSAPETSLPLDFLTPDSVGLGQGRRVSRRLDVRHVLALTRCAHEHQASTFMVLLCALELVIHQWTRRDDLLIGVAVSNRPEPALQETVGCFTNLVTVRTSFAGVETLDEALARCIHACRDALAHQGYPFQVVVRDLSPKTRLGAMPLFRVGFWMHDYVEPVALDGCGLVWPQIVDTATSELDIRVLAVPGPHGMEIILEYNSARFREQTARALLESFCAMLPPLLEEPHRCVRSLTLDALLTAAPSARVARRLRIVSNVAADPVGDITRYCLQRVGLDTEIEYIVNSVAGMVPVTGGGETAGRSADATALLIDVQAWLGTSDPTRAIENLQFGVRQFLDGLHRQTLSGSTLLLYLRRPAQDDGHSGRLSAALEEAVALVHEEVRRNVDIHVFDLNTLLAPQDPLSGAAVEWVGAVAMIIARHVHALWSKPFKVIALDCDNTLWRGNCAELGPQGVRIEAGHFALQRRVKELRQKGFLLCLISKNVEADVMQVFRDRDLPLCAADFACTRINWLSKADNLESLAEELGLDTNSWVFLDDSAVECAEVRERCPRALVLQIPPDPQEITPLLDRIWAFDKLVVTDADQNRAAAFAVERERRSVRGSSRSLQDFISGLQLVVQVQPAQPSDLHRLAQLTQRCNQFNLTDRRYTTANLVQWLDREERHCWSVRVSDRFGDYGLSGALLLEGRGVELVVDVFVLSCRVLGRAVEFEVLEALRRFAAAKSFATIEIPFVRTRRNVPAVSFLQRAWPLEFGGEISGGLYRCAVSLDAADQRLPLEQALVDPPVTLRDKQDGTTEDAMHARALEQIAMMQAPAATVVEDWRRLAASSGPATAYIPPRPGLEAQIAEIVASVLRVETVGREDSFFELGGYSINALQLLARISKEFSLQMSLDELFEGPTVRELAASVASRLVQKDHVSNLVHALVGMSESEAQAALSSGRMHDG